MFDGFALEVFGVSPPFFVRKVDRRGHWEDAQKILDCVFPLDADDTISVYRVECDGDVMRIAIALNANRVATNPQGASYTEPLLLVAVTEEDFGAVPLRQVSGLTECLFANRRHYNALFSQNGMGSHDRRARLVNSLLASGRKPGSLTKGRLKEALKMAESDGCHAVVGDSVKCKCE